MGKVINEIILIFFVSYLPNFFFSIFLSRKKLEKYQMGNLDLHDHSEFLHRTLQRFTDIDMHDNVAITVCISK